MKEYGDEGFINLIRERQEEAVWDIKAGRVLVDGKNIIFREREVIKGKLWIWMPDEFGPLSKDLARLKYPNENRPDVIYTNKETTVNVTFSHKREKLKEGEEEEIRNYMKEIVKRVQTSSEMIEEGTVKTEEGCFLAWFDFVTPAIDTDIYNLMFFSSLGGRLLIGSCNCLDADREDWKVFFMQMLGTVRYCAK